ncbi:MAG: hypothetical protein Rubg2KO_21550 [Rubricoccaceae bacterium]
MDRLLDRALDLPKEQRAAFVQEVSGHDNALRERLEQLLRAVEEGFTEEAQAIVSPMLLERPRTVGSFRLCELLGHGGMGAVYRAERDIEGATQVVAVKIIRPELLPLASPHTVRRFAQERAVLSRLGHPHIARFMDGGETREGTPYLAMEFVRGTSITAFCADEALPLRDRVQLVQVVAQAVAFAHRQLVVHRDLKPSNLLVARADDGTPTPKVIDFGIAKLLAPTADETDALLTAPGVRVLTPEYAAPEQLRGEEVGVSADIYALGVILYEVLTGVRPFQADSRHELEQIVYQMPPTRPSLRLVDSAPSRTGVTERSLRGDLDWICLKALRKDPEQRYRSASELADDLENYLHGRPVWARRPTLRYRASRFIRRNRAPLAVAVSLVVTMLGGLGASLWQARLAAVERDRATAEARRSEEASAFLADLLSLGDPFDAPVPTTSAALADTGLARLQRADTMDGILKTDVALQLAHVFRGQGRYSLEETAAQLAVGALTGTDASPLQFARAYLDHAVALRTLGRPGEAVAAARRAATYASAATDGALAVDVATELGLSLVDHGEADEAVAVLREAVAGFDADSMMLLVLLDTQAAVLDAAGRFDEAVVVGARAVEISKKVLGTVSAEAQITPHNYALILISARRFAEAETILTEVVRREAATLGNDHPSHAISLANLADLEMRTGRVESARARASRTAEILENAGGDGTIAAIQSRLTEAVALSRLGQNAEAEALFRRLLAFDEETLPPLARAEAEYLYGIFLQQIGQVREGEAFRQRATLLLSLSERRGLDELSGFSRD